MGLDAQEMETQPEDEGYEGVPNIENTGCRRVKV